MKNLNVLMSVIFMLFILTLTSCEAIGDIFSAGMYTGFFIVLVVVIIIIVIISKMGKRG